MSCLQCPLHNESLDPWLCLRSRRDQMSIELGSLNSSAAREERNVWICAGISRSSGAQELFQLPAINMWPLCGQLEFGHSKSFAERSCQALCHCCVARTAKQAFRCSAAERRNVYSTPLTKRLAAPEERNVLVSGAHKWADKDPKASVAINISCLRH